MTNSPAEPPSCCDSARNACRPKVFLLLALSQVLAVPRGRAAHDLPAADAARETLGDQPVSPPAGHVAVPGERSLGADCSRHAAVAYVGIGLVPLSRRSD